ncbi:hypothetical protein DMENIID0001_087190 [Sergentomyia squamirostris]
MRCVGCFLFVDIQRGSPTSSWSASPSIVRREPILKPRGSVKSEKKVSIKNEVPINIEYIGEKKRSGSSGSFGKIPSPGPLSASRTAAFVYASRGDRAEKAFKMTRSYSFDNDSMDKGIELKDVPCSSIDPAETPETQPLVKSDANSVK